MTTLPTLDHCTAKEAAARLGIRPHAVLVALKEKRLAGFRLGIYWYVYTEDLDGYHERSAAARKHIACRNLHAQDDAPRTGYCPRCNLELNERGACDYCAREAAGVPYYAGRVDVCWPSSLTGRIR